MIKLGSPVEPVWLDLGQGVRVLDRIFDPVADVAGSRAWANAMRAGVQEFGIPDGERPDEDQQAMIDAQASIAELVAIAKRSIVDWEGVADVHGQSLPVTGQSVAAFLAYPGMAAAYRTARFLQRQAWSAEGHGFATSLNGISVEAPNTAGTVEN